MRINVIEKENSERACFICGSKIEDEAPAIGYSYHGLIYNQKIYGT